MKLLAGPSTRDRDRGPFKEWPIFLGERLDRSVEMEYPDDGESFGTVFRNAGHADLDPAARRIVIYPASDAVELDIRRMTGWLLRGRNQKWLVGAATPELIAGLKKPIHLTELGETWEGIRCEEVGCDSFSGWHRMDIRKMEPSQPHSTCDLGQPTFRCRLVLRSGGWVLDVGTRVSWADDPLRNGHEMANAILIASSRAAELNDMRREAALMAEGTTHA